MDQFVGKKLGNYDVIEMIGKGGMAAVYRAHQPSMNRSVAIKVMATQFGSDDEFVLRFKNEAQQLAQLEHAHILPVYDFGEQEGVLYIVMRYLPTGTLADRITPEGMEARTAARFFRQLASALDYAHSRGVIHRDLKPSNVLIDQQNNAFLADFGIAKSLDNASKLTGTGGVVGTPTYMSPEQGLGEPLDARSDIYALGVMLFEMLSGEPPFQADNPMAVMLKHINDAPPDLTVLNPKVTPAVEAVVMRALAKEPAKRYAAALEMADALDEAVATGAVPRQAAGFTDPSSTLALPPVEATRGLPIAGQTLAAPVPAQPAGTTALPGAGTVVGGAAPPAAAPVLAPPIAITFNSLSAWLAKNQWIGPWSQAGLLSLATFLMLARLTEGALTEIAVLSLIPGLLLYGLLRAPTLGALVSFVLVLVPLAARAPALAILWTALTVLAGSRLHSREIMLTLVTVVAAGHPLGWLVPLLAPWWIKARQVVLAVALGAIFATLFALTLGWPSAGGLLPVSEAAAGLASGAQMAPFNTSYFGLLEPDAWSVWQNPAAVMDSLRGTLAALGGAFAASGGLPLVTAVAWSLAAVLSVSNRQSEQPLLRAMGLGLGLLTLIVGTLLLRGSARIPAAQVSGLIGGLVAAGLAFALSQWPVQSDPNGGNRVGTVLRLLRQSMGALFMALGVAYFSRQLADTPLYPVFWLGGTAGTLAMITNPLIGPPIVFAALVAAFAVVSPVMTVAGAALLGAYLMVNLLFDKRRPRAWNPLGAGMLLGSPGMALAGLLPLGPLSIGALEAQVPAAILAALSHTLLIATARDASPFVIIIQLVTTLIGVLLVERLMGSGLLDSLHHRLRRLIFTAALALLMAVSYYGIARVETRVGELASLPAALGISLFAAVALVAAMGKRAMYWRQFVEREAAEESEFEDEEVTGAVKKAAAR